MSTGPSPCDKKFTRQLVNLSMKLLGLIFLILSFFETVSEYPGQAFNRLPFTASHLLWVKLFLGHNLKNRIVTA